MKQARLLVILILITQTTFAQKNTIKEYLATDKKALQLPDSLSRTTDNIAKYITTNFQTEKDKTRAIFIWVATNIQYDVDNMYAMNFYEKKEEKIAKPLKTRKGICENYAALFNDICSKSGIKAFVVEGYTQQNGFADYIPHAWCAAQVDSVWYLFDPTWGSGYFDEAKFIRKINNDYYKTNPSTLIKSHMPFDYLWQFLNYPITNQEFYEGKTQENKSKAYFNFIDSIHVYEGLNHTEQLVSSARRIEKNGIKNSLIFDRLQHIKLEIEHGKQSKAVNLYNAAVVDYNNGVKRLNEFIDYRNRQFTPQKADIDIQNMIDTSSIKLNEVELKLEQINTTDVNLKNMIIQLTDAVDDASAQVTLQQNWLKVYFSKGRSGRRSLLYDRKVTWFGIPLN